MAKNDFGGAESPDNYEQKCCCVLVLDVSGSMKGKPIEELNNGMQQFYNDIENDVVAPNRLEIGVVAFSDTVETYIEPTLVSNFVMPVLTTKGTTKLVDGIREGIRLVRESKARYKRTGQSYYRPWIIVITDGAPDDDQDVDGLSAEIKGAFAKKEFMFLAVGVANADMNVLNKISDPSKPPSPLSGLKFSTFFKWLSDSMTAVTGSKEGEKIKLPDTSAWREIET